MIAEVDDEPDGPAVMTLARTHLLTVYDASYLELAGRRKLPLCTLDKQLIAAATKDGVNVWTP
jgi:predicted nucleic acid-binding protein